MRNVTTDADMVKLAVMSLTCHLTPVKVFNFIFHETKVFNFELHKKLYFMHIKSLILCYYIKSPILCK